jgi:hypothetical protein
MKTYNPVSCRGSALFILLSLFVLFFTGFARAQVGTPLTINCPPNLNLWTCNSNIVWQYPAPTVTGGCEGRQVICTPPSGSTFPLGVTTVTCRVFDSCNNSASCSFTVTVRQDTEPPRIECPPDMTVLACPNAAGGCGALVTYPAPIAVDNSGSVAVSCTPPSGTFLVCGDHIVTCVAQDPCGNKDSCRFVVSVKEGGFAPGIQCPADRVITTCSNSAVLVYPAPVVNPPGTTVVCTPPSGTIVPLGVHQITCIASNGCGRAECTFKVTVRPLPQVTIQCPTNTLIYTIPCGSNCAPVVYPLPTVFNGALESCNPPLGTCLPEGVHVIVCRGTNQCGGVLCEFPVRVIKGQGSPPEIRCPNDMTVTTCSNSATVVYPAPLVIPAGTSVTCTPASGSIFPAGTTVVTCVASNDCGRAQCQFNVTVRRIPEPSIQCPANITVTTCSNSATVTYPLPVVPAGLVPTCTPPSGSIFPLGDTTVICVVSNDCGRAVCEFKVTVRRIPPVSIQCPTNTLVFTIPCGSNCVPVIYPLPTVVNGALESCNPPSGTCLPEGVHVIVCRGTNQCGGVLCEFPVRVIKGQGNPPGLQCPNDLTVTTCSNSATVFYPAPVVVPASTSVNCTPPSGSIFPAGDTTVTCVASNDCGRSVCQFKVTVRRIPPVSILCPTNNLVFTIPCGSNCVPVIYPLPTVVNGALESCNPPQGTCLPEGVHVIVCRGTNQCGGVLCEFPVRVIKGQGEPPIIRCPQDITLVTCSNCVPLVFPRPTVINGTLLGCNPPPGTCLPVGTYTVTCVASNACGRSTCEFRVRVIKGDEVPHMTVTQEHGYLVVCWTKTCKCFKLQVARQLTSPLVWTDVTDEPLDLGDRYCVRVPIGAGMLFFRLVSCDRATATVYDVTGLPITRSAAGALADALGLPPNQVMFGDGSVRFLNPQTFQAIPMRRISDPALIEALRQETEDNKDELALDGIDFDALRGLKVLSGDEAMDKFARALKAAELMPENGRLVPRHTMLELSDANGDPTLPAVQIDTRVNMQFELGGLPVIGPGAKLNIAFGPEGAPTALLGSFRAHKPFMEIPILSLDEAADRCRKLYPQLGAQVQPRLVYFAPSLDLPGVQRLIPCYECAGDGVAGGEAVQLLRSIIPATDDPAFAPLLDLEADAHGTLVNARATVRGGTPPYRYQWISSSVDLGGMFPPDAASIEYNAAPRAEARTETVRVVVTDANGVQVQGSRILVLGPIIGGLEEVLIAPAVAGVSDYGIERGVSDLCAGQQAAFNARMMPAGYTRQFNFSGLSAWERDFKEGGTGLDHLYVDNADMTFYMGHGYGGGFTFEGSNDDGTLHYSDAVKAWGDKDLEWLALLSCSVMADTYDGKSCFTRWTPAFDGLHLMMGFANTAYDSDGFAGTFADWMLGRFGFLPPVPVRSAWLLSTDSNQPSSVIASIMGVIGPSGWSNYNDYFHGRGPVGPDIRGSNIRGFWRITY